MIWYALRPLVESDPVRALGFLANCADPQVYKNIVRRIASDFDLNAKLMPQLVKVIAATLDRGDLLQARAGVQGVGDALQGLSGIQAPSNWSLLTDSNDAGIQEEASKLEPVFDQGIPMSAKDWLDLLDNQSRRNQAIRELAAFDDPKIAGIILRPYGRYLTDDRQATISTLSSRESFAGPLLQAMRNGQVKRADVSAFYARQIYNLGNNRLNKLLEEVWGQLRRSPEEKQKVINSWQSKLTLQVLAKASIANGETIFQSTCASCHSLYGEGGALGPHLDGSDRQNLYYLLENLIDPSAVLPQDYRMNVITLKDGRVLSGNVSAQTRHTLTIAGLDSVEMIPLSEVKKQEQFEQSTMPEGLLQALNDQGVADLIAFLQQ